MTFRKFRKQYRVKKILICKNKKVGYKAGCATGICINRIDNSKHNFKLYCKFSNEEIAGLKGDEDEGQVKVF